MSPRFSDSNLFKPIKVGDGKITLNHRVVHAPTSRSRSTGDGSHFPTDLMLEYYDSRSRSKGTLIIFESCLVSPRSGLVPYKSGVWSKSRCKALKKITDKIHANGSYVSCQIFAPGRIANIEEMKEKNLPYTAPSSIYHSKIQEEQAETHNYPLRALTIEEIKEIQDDFVQAAINCIEEAGFDFVELHGSSGFLIEQFLSPISNTRNDQYGGSVENRCRFLIEIIEKLIEHVGASRIGLRLSAWSQHFGMVYPENVYTDHPPLTFCNYIVEYLEQKKNKGDEIAYVSISEPRVSGSTDQDPKDHTNEPLINRWSGILIRAGGYATNYKAQVNTINTSLLEHVNSDNRTLIAFSRPFTSNPDLVERLRKNFKLDNYQREFFYTHLLNGYLTYGDYIDEQLDSNRLIFTDSELNREGVPLA